MADSKKYNGSTWEHSLRKLGTATDTITTLPADLYADGTNATVDLVGNMEQAGTPTPQNPIQPSECGDRTGNLFDGATAYGAMYSDGVITGQGNAIYAIKNKVTADMIGKTYTISLTPLAIVSRAFLSITINGTVYWRDKELTVNQRSSFQFTPVTENDLWAISYNEAGVYSYKDIMVNEGSTALPYEPYGYKIPISSANTTTPVYLGEVETTRKIKKLVVDGTENWNEGTSNYYIFINVSGRGDGIPNSTALSTHTESGVVTNNNGTALFFKKSVFVHSSLADFKTFLQQQYAAGTPVTVWYVLAEPTTGIVNEPIRKIGNYVDTVSGISIPTTTGKDTFDVLTTLKPSEVSLSYTGWHGASVGEWDGSEWQ